MHIGWILALDPTFNRLGTLGTIVKNNLSLHEVIRDGVGVTTHDSFKDSEGAADIRKLHAEIDALTKETAS